MFFPLAMLVAVLPGLCALNAWDLTPPGPWWGLRGLAVLQGHAWEQAAAVAPAPALEARAYHAVASQPPLYAWLVAAGLALSPDRDPLAAVLPSYIAGVAVVVLVYLHGRLWRGPGMGLIAAVLTGFNRDLLVQMQQASPATLALAGALGALLGHAMLARGRSAAAASSSFSTAGSGWRPRPACLAALAGLGLGLSLMAVGLFGLLVLPVIGLHWGFLGQNARVPAGGETRGGEPSRRRRWLERPDARLGILALGVLLVVAGPWHVAALRARGFEALGALFVPFDAMTATRPALLPWLIRLAPAVVPLALYGAARAVRRGLADDSNAPETVGPVFWTLWLGVASLGPAFWPSGPRTIEGLFLVVPLNLLAAEAVSDLATRRIPVRVLNWVAPATAVSIAWWASSNLSGSVDDLIHGRADTTTALGLHLALDLAVLAVWLTRRIDHWARRRDDRQRWVLAVFLGTVLAVTMGAGSREAWFRHRETDDLLLLRSMILRRERDRPFTQVAVVGPEVFRQSSGDTGAVPGGRLRFILRSALPDLPQLDVAETDDLLRLPEIAPDGQRLVILAGRNQRLPHAVQSRLQLEAIHPGRHGVLDAFATAHDTPAAKVARRPRHPGPEHADR